jgi:large subunit ribosomal protein L23
MSINNVIIKPIITEKSSADAANGKYTFCVNVGASKHAVKHEIQKLFGVDVINVCSMIVPGKKKRIGKTNKFTKTKRWKKALVSLKEGQHIDLFEKVA